MSLANKYLNYLNSKHDFPHLLLDLEKYLKKHRFDNYNCPILDVDDAYEVKNGMSGMMRDVIIHLCGLMNSELDKVKTIIGMCDEHTKWVKHTFFMRIRETCVLNNFFQIPENRKYSLSPISRTALAWQKKYVFSDSGYQTVFLSAAILEGVWRWTVQISYSKTGISRFCLGATATERRKLGRWDNDFLGKSDTSSSFLPSSSFFFRRWDGNRLYSSLCGVKNAWDIPLAETVVPDQSIVSIEADIAARTLAFFVGDVKEGGMGSVKVPRVISDVPLNRPTAPLYLGISGWGRNSSFTFVSLHRILSTTPSSAVACKYYQCISE